MHLKLLCATIASLAAAASPAWAQFSVTSQHMVNVNGNATPSTLVPLGTYAWTRTGSLEGLYDRPPAGAVQPAISSYATTPVIDAAYAANAMGSFTAPAEFEARPWGTPPLVNHPVAVTATPDGTVFVAMDGNGSLGASGHLGRIVRLRDTDKDGTVDEAKPFVPDVDSPRGVIWYQDHLIALVVPDVVAYYDRDGDGIAEDKKTLVSGIGFGIRQATVDHGTQNIELGIDGWIYMAVGDIGMMKATGSDGRTLQMRHGGIVRFRPDGSGLDVFATGTRNNYGLAIGPLLDAFARDNTNDGGGWNVRLHHFTGMTHHGYPSLFINFPEEMVAPLADFGGGSGVGGMWLDEPGIPAKWNDAPFTIDYGQQAIFRHAIVPKGATYSLPGYNITANSVAGVPLADPAAQTEGVAPAGNEPFLRAGNLLDADVDGNSNIYLVRWLGGGFNWGTLMHGMVYKVTPKDFTPAPLPDFSRISAPQLVEVLNGPSHVRRMAAQHAILQRKAELGAQIAPMLQSLAADRTKPLKNRVAALFTDRLLRGAQATAPISQLVSDPTIASWALRALGDDLALAKGVPLQVVTNALRSPDPRTRKEALITLARADAQSAAPAMTALLSDSDVIVRHTAVQALGSLRAVDANLAVVDNSTSADQRKGALMVLQMIHEPRVTNALIQRLTVDQSAERQLEIVSALGRLANTEAQWNGSWWATRPSTVGPYYAPAPWSESTKVVAALNATLDKAGPEQTLAIARQYIKQGVSAGPAVNKFLALADAEPALLPQITAYFATAEEIPANAVPVLTRTATTTTNPAGVRSEAVMALTQTADRNTWAAILPTIPSLAQAAAAGGGGRGGGGRGGAAAPAAPAIPGLNAVQQLLVSDLGLSNTSRLQAVASARAALITAAFSGDAQAISRQASSLADSELALAQARAEAFAAIQASTARLSPQQVSALVAQQAVAAPAAAPAAAGGRGGGGGQVAAATPLDRARNAVLNSPKLDDVYPVLIAEAEKLNGESSQLADAALLTLSARKFGAQVPREAATQALDNAWGNDPRRRSQIILAAVTARDTSRATQIIAATRDSDAGVARAAQYAMQQLNIDPAQLAAAVTGPKVSTMPVAAVLDAVTAARGSVARGQQLTRELGCIACHTVSASEAPKGPPLNLVSGILNRRATAEAILQPNKTLAQGFATVQINRRSGDPIVGFVVQESSEAVTIRDIAAQQTRIPIGDIANRSRMDGSMMPEGLANDLTVTEFASLLDYIESLAQ